MDSPTTTAAGVHPVGSGASVAASGSNAPGNASLESFPPLWVTRWVDYTSKYGLGYVLSDGTFGVVFNDATKMTQSALDDARDDADGGPNERHAASPDTTTAPPAAADGVGVTGFAACAPAAAVAAATVPEKSQEESAEWSNFCRVIDGA